MDRQLHIVLQRHGGMAILRKAGVSQPAVWPWPEAFVEAGVEGLVRGRGKPPGKKLISAAINREIVAKTWKERPANATPWSVPTMPRRLASAARACIGSGPGTGSSRIG